MSATVATFTPELSVWCINIKIRMTFAAVAGAYDDFECALREGGQSAVDDALILSVTSRRMYSLSLDLATDDQIRTSLSSTRGTDMSRSMARAVLARRAASRMLSEIA